MFYILFLRRGVYNVMVFCIVFIFDGILGFLIHLLFL